MGIVEAAPIFLVIGVALLIGLIWLLPWKVWALALLLVGVGLFAHYSNAAPPPSGVAPPGHPTTDGKYCVVAYGRLVTSIPLLVDTGDIEVFRYEASTQGMLSLSFKHPNVCLARPAPTWSPRAQQTVDLPPHL